MMNLEKLDFLQNYLIAKLLLLPAEEKGKWGKMNAQQMVEHLNGFFQVSTNEIHFPIVTPVEHLPKYKEFLMSDKPFRENTKAPVLPDEPFPLRHGNMQTAIDELQQTVKRFFSLFENNSDLKISHPVFGELDFEEWVQLHHKHVVHHLTQFGLM
jgi:hypothetical protein